MHQSGYCLPLLTCLQLKPSEKIALFLSQFWSSIIIDAFEKKWSNVKKYQGNLCQWLAASIIKWSGWKNYQGKKLFNLGTSSTHHHHRHNHHHRHPHHHPHHHHHHHHQQHHHHHKYYEFQGHNGRGSNFCSKSLPRGWNQLRLDIVIIIINLIIFIIKSLLSSLLS